MITFKDFDDLSEALRIVKKNVDKELQKQKELPPEDDNIIGTVGKYKVIQTHHISHTRDYENKPRNHGMDKKDYLRVIELFLKKRIPQDGKTYHLFYKQNGKYNNLVVNVEDDKIVVVTVMQMQKRDTKDYFSKPGNIRLTLEKYLGENVEIIVIEEEI